MPRGRVDEKLWNEAKRVVAPHADKYEEPYAVVMTVYKSMLAAKKKRPKAKPKACPCAKCRAKRKRKPKA
jgi:hypothetical protein